MKTTVSDGGNNIRRRSKALSEVFKQEQGNERLAVDFFCSFEFFSKYRPHYCISGVFTVFIYGCAGVMLSSGEVEILQASVRRVCSTFLLFLFFNPSSRSVCSPKKSVAAGE